MVASSRLDHYRVAWRRWLPTLANGRSLGIVSSWVSSCPRRSFASVRRSAPEAASGGITASLSVTADFARSGALTNGRHHSSDYSGTSIEHALNCRPYPSIAPSASTASPTPTPTSGATASTPAFATDTWTDDRDRPNRPALGDVGPEWTAATPLRIAADRRQAQVEIDALVALMLGVTAEELCTVYRTQFAVLYGYDHHEYTYDANGRLVPNAVLKVWRAKGDRITRRGADAHQPGGLHLRLRAALRHLDREEDMRRAYAEFERRLAETVDDHADRSANGRS